MRQTIYLLLIAFLLPLVVNAQTNEIKKMRQQVNNLQQQIAKKENILLSSKKDIESKLNDLSLLSAQIVERKELVNLLIAEINTLNKELERLNALVGENEALVKEKKKEYDRESLKGTEYEYLLDEDKEWED